VTRIHLAEWLAYKLEFGAAERVEYVTLENLSVTIKIDRVGPFSEMLGRVLPQTLESLLGV
jgi:hypothetical protein